MTFLRWARIHWDRVGGSFLIGLGGIFILVGWNRVSGEALTAQQIPYVISGGIGGLFLLGVGGMLWLSADLRDEWRKLDAIEQRLPAHAEEAEDDAEVDPFTSDLPEVRTNGRVRRRAPLRSTAPSGE
jgi:hypothetical protein